MKKVIVLVLCCLFSFCSLVGAESPVKKSFGLIVNKPKIVFVWTGDQNLKADDKTEEMINKKFELKFPKEKYQVVQDNKVYQELLIIAEDKDIVNLDELKRADYITAGQKFGYDYVVILPFYAISYEFSNGFWSNTYRVNVSLRARIVDVKTGEYLYRQDGVEKGSSSSGFGSPSYLRAQRDGAEKCLDNVFTELAIGEKYTKN